jgi:hypothetical protein
MVVVVVMKMRFMRMHMSRSNVLNKRSCSEQREGNDAARHDGGWLLAVLLGGGAV